MNHAGRVAIVTGAGQGAGGVGRAIARRLVEEGARVLVTDVDEGSESSANAIRAATGGDAIHHAGNLAKESVAVELVQLALARWGRLGILVNNAGGGIILPFLEHTPETLRETLDRNLWTTLWRCRAALPAMIERSYGRIINIGADSVRNGLWNHAGYNAAKGGVHGLTTGLAREYAHLDISVNTIAPCLVNTPRYQASLAANPALAEKFRSVIVKGRAAEVEEIAAFASFIAGAEAGFITGQVLSINGGSAML
ncbi:MAG: SDR family oxidoreductase [Betaproteobacteria bacterium]|nr:SDR family oxidoreductase [Betaproteobacteria bacterium]